MNISVSDNVSKPSPGKPRRMKRLDDEARPLRELDGLIILGDSAALPMD
jgi:hypothetical protein